MSRLRIGRGEQGERELAAPLLLILAEAGCASDDDPPEDIVTFGSAEDANPDCQLARADPHPSSGRRMEVAEPSGLYFLATRRADHDVSVGVLDVAHRVGVGHAAFAAGHCRQQDWNAPAAFPPIRPSVRR